MSPSPKFIHQKVVVTLSAYLYQAIVVNKLGQVITSPFDVVLSRRDVFQPDILVVLNEHLERLQEKCVMGAPDLVVEVISPSSKLYDRVNKHMAYEQAGIREYWLVDPHNQTIELFALEGGNYYSLGIFHGEQILPSRVVPQMASAAQFFT